MLWDFLQQLLNDRQQKYSDLIAWKCRDTGVFKIVDPAGLAKLWGIQKNHLSMNYDKMSRALRYYYRVNILRKVQGERHCYQFLRNPTELKNIKNISLLRQTIGNASAVSGSSASTTGANGVTSWAVPGQNPHQSANNPSSIVSNGNNSPQVTASQRSLAAGNNPLNLPSGISSAAAAVAAAAAAAYGPPPSSPLFMHAINGAFHYLSSNGGITTSTANLPVTPTEKFQFTSLLKTEQNSSTSSPEDSSSVDEMKPTDLSVAGNNNCISNSNTGKIPGQSEKRPYSSPSAHDDSYP